MVIVGYNLRFREKTIAFILREHNIVKKLPLHR